MNWRPGERRSHVFLRFRHGSLFRLFIDEAGRLVFESGPDMVELRITDDEGADWFRQFVPLGGERTTLRVSTTPVPSLGHCTLTIKEQNTAVLAAAPSATAELVPTGRADAVRTVSFDRLESGSAAGKFDIELLPWGEYDLRVRIEKNGRVLDRAACRFGKGA